MAYKPIAVTVLTSFQLDLHIKITKGLTSSDWQAYTLRFQVGLLLQYTRLSAHTFLLPSIWPPCVCFLWTLSENLAPTHTFGYNTIVWTVRKLKVLLMRLHSNKLNEFSTVYIREQIILTFRHHASYIQDRRTAIPQSALFIYLVNKYIIQLFF